MKLARAFSFLFLVLPLPLIAAAVSVSSSKLLYTGDDPGFYGYFQTASPQLWDMLYEGSTHGTSHVVFNYNGNVFDMQDPGDSVVIPMHAVGSGLGAYVEGAKAVGNLVFGQRFTIVNNPRTGLQPDTIQYTLWITNNGPVTVNVGARLLLDLQLIDSAHDNAFISVNNGFNALSVNTIYRANAGGVPGDWWDYDSDPAVTTPQLVGRGVTSGNPYNASATPPDAMEAVSWIDVEPNDTWNPDPYMGQAYSSYSPPDTCIVLWWTGTGQEGNSSAWPAIALPAGQTQTFITYYGLNQGPLLTTATPYYSFSPTPSITPTFSVTPTFTVSPTISPTFSITPTFTQSPTFSVSPTITESFTVSPTFSFSPTVTPTLTITPTPSATGTVTSTPSHTVTPTRSPTPTISATYTITPTGTITPVVTAMPTYTVTPEKLLLTPKPPNPNPSDGSGVWLPYVLTTDAWVRIKVYTVAGELLRSLDPFSGKKGANEQFWDERNDAGIRVASGVFVYRIEAVAGMEVKSAFMKLAVVR